MTTWFETNRQDIKSLNTDFIKFTIFKIKQHKKSNKPNHNGCPVS